MSTRLLSILTLATLAAGFTGCTVVEEEHPYYGPRREAVIVDHPRYRDPVIVQQPGYVAPPPGPTYVAPPPPPTYVEPAPVVVEQPDVTVVTEAPPPPRIEVRPARPWADGVWINGYWNHGPRGWVWVGGRWDHPRPGYRWDAPRWDRGPGGRFSFHAGGWIH